MIWYLQQCPFDLNSASSGFWLQCQRMSRWGFGFGICTPHRQRRRLQKRFKNLFFFHIGFLKQCNNTGTINNILPSSGCLSDRCLIALFLMSVWQAMSDDDVEETEFLDDAEALFGSQFLGGSNHCPTIPGQHSKALKDPHHPYKSVFLV